MAIARDLNKKRAPMHPGEILREEFMLPRGVSAHALALALRVPATRISEIVNGRRGITAETAYRLSVHFGTSADFWMNLQSTYELACVERDLAVQIKKEVQPSVVA